LGAEKDGPVLGSGQSSDTAISDHCHPNTTKLTQIATHRVSCMDENDTAVEYFLIGASNFTLREIEVVQTADETSLLANGAQCTRNTNSWRGSSVLRLIQVKAEMSAACRSFAFPRSRGLQGARTGNMSKGFGDRFMTTAQLAHLYIGASSLGDLKAI
jgi:hypothetical protein